MTPSRRGQAVSNSLLIIIVVVSLVAVVGAGAVAEQPSTESLTMYQDDEDPTYNETRHQHPDDADEDGDSEELADWLSNQLSGSLGESTLQLSEGEYDAARSVLGDDYDERFGQFVEVNGDTDGGGDDEDDNETEDAFEEAKENQEELTDAVEEYEETREEYEAAREAGDEQQARELARDLEDLADRVNSTGIALEGNYRVISETTSGDLTEEESQITEIRDDIEATQAEIRQDTFVETQLTASVESADASFTDPLEIEGQLSAADGTTLDSERVQVRVDGRVVATTTDDDGRFELSYRPALLPADADTVRVEFVPDRESPYLRSEADAPIEPTRSDPTIEIESVTERAAFGDEVVVEGTIDVDEIPADQVPVTLSFDGEHRTEPVRTADDGSFVTTTSVPATVPDGEASLVVEYSPSDRVLTNASQSESIRIDATETQLDMTADETEQGVVAIEGELVAADGTPVSGQPVRLSLEGSAVGTVQTGSDGSFEETIEVSEVDVPDDRAVLFVARYDGDGRNLNTAEDESAVSISEPVDSGASDGSASGSSGPLDALPDWDSTTGLIGALVILALGGAYLWYRSTSNGRLLSGSVLSVFGSTAGTEDDSTTEPSSTDADLNQAESDTPAPEPSADKQAQSLLESGQTNEATIIAYELTRSRLASQLENSRPRTYWEFYTDWCESGSNSTNSDALQTLTEAYERATFTPETISHDDADTAIAAAKMLSAD